MALAMVGEWEWDPVKSSETEPESDSDKPWAMDKALATAAGQESAADEVSATHLGQQLAMEKGSGCCSH